jgi:hypothetical protein
MPDPTPQSEPWERQPGEPNLWFSRFERFRLTGPTRTLLGMVNAELVEQGRSRQLRVPGAWNRAFAKWRWRERAEAWDESERQKVREAHSKEIDEMNRRHIQEAKALQQKAVQRLQSLKPEELSGFEVLRFLLDAAKLERSAQGEPETVEERRLTGKDGNAVVFSFEDALNANKELETWKNDHVQPPAGPTIPEGNQQVP